MGHERLSAIRSWGIILAADGVTNGHGGSGVNPNGNHDLCTDRWSSKEVGLLFMLSNPSVTRASAHHAVTIEVCVEESQSELVQVPIPGYQQS